MGRTTKFPVCATCGVECRSLVYCSTRDGLCYCMAHWDEPHERDMEERAQRSPSRKQLAFIDEEPMRRRARGRRKP